MTTIFPLPSLDDFNAWADYWYYTIGVNVIPADTRNKVTYIKWSECQNKPIPEEVHNQWKNTNAFANGIAIIVGQVWRGEHVGEYLIFIDLDNKKAIEKFCEIYSATTLEQIATKFIVEQHRDNPHKCHIYFYSEIPFVKKSSDLADPKFDKDKLPAFEVKGQGNGIAYCTPSLHQDGERYQILGVSTPVTLNETQATELMQHLDFICKEYGLKYLEYDNNGSGDSLIPTTDLFKDDFVIYEGHNRHLALLRTMDSLIERNSSIFSPNEIKEMAYKWNQKHCVPPKTDKEFEENWKEASKFIIRKEKEEENNDDNDNNGKNNINNNNNTVIVELIIEHSKSLKRTLVLKTDGLYLLEESKILRENSKSGEKIPIESKKTSVITMRAPILKKVLKIGGQVNKELLIVAYGDREITGNVKEICDIIATAGGTPSSKFKSYVSAIIEAQRKNVPIEVTYPAVGIFENPETKELVLAAPQYNNVFAIEQAKENGEVNKRIGEVAKRTNNATNNEEEEVKSVLIGYMRLPTFYKVPVDSLPALGYAVSSPFAYELKKIETSDYFCQLLQYGSFDIGKSTILNICTEDLYGVPRRGIDAIDSSHRLLQILNATTLPQHIAEIEMFDFNEYADTIKNGTDTRDVGSRYNADQTRNEFAGRSPLFYSANTYKASKDSLLVRVIINQMQTTSDDIKDKTVMFDKMVRSRTKQKTIGYEILKHIIARYPYLQTLSREINQIRKDIINRCAIPDIAVRFTDQRRTLTYALMLFGIRQWQSFIGEYYPKAIISNACAEMWFNKYSKLELFIEDIVRPLEETSKEVLQQQNQAAAFTAWLESYIAREGDKEEGHTWMRAKKGDYVYITEAILQRYKEFCQRSGGAAYESLSQLGVDLTAHTGEGCKPYPNQIGLDEMRDPTNDSRIIKLAVAYRSRKVVKVPLSLQGKLVASTTTAITTRTTQTRTTEDGRAAA